MLTSDGVLHPIQGRPQRSQTVLPLGGRESQVGQGGDLATRVAREPTDEEGEAQETKTHHAPEPQLFGADKGDDPEGDETGQDPHQTAEKQWLQLCRILLLHLLSTYVANVGEVSPSVDLAGQELLFLGWRTDEGVVSRPRLGCYYQSFAGSRSWQEADIP